MFNVNDFLDRAKKAAKVESDYALAVKVLGFRSPSRIANWRSGDSVPNEAAIMQLCALSGDDPEHVAACLQSMRAANDDAAGLWRRVAERLKGSVGAIFVVSVVTAGVIDATSTPAYAAAGASLYIMSNALRRLVMRLCALRFRPARDLPGAF